MASPVAMASSSRYANERNAYNLSKISNSLIADDSIKWQEKVAVGIKFNPNDEVLASHYLVGKLSGSTEGPIFSLIKEVDVYQHDPSDLSRMFAAFITYIFPFLLIFSGKFCRDDKSSYISKLPICRLAYDFGKGKMYFFAPLNKKYKAPVPTGGYWKKTREPCCVKGKDGNSIATKNTLVYYKNDPKSNPVKTQWLMKEYMLLDNQLLPKQNVEDSWTLCVVYHSKRQVDGQKVSAEEEDEFSSDSCEDSTSDMSSSDSD
ncbi:NAC domain-containing protein [Melia azedarach]|uniref:NAC domain-containing protein n=1 Tax=Melia azedarach TaxID=155640 RepID=A0ACC1XC03_MELAZ|nr:NAC domain-containing protein [Melia azedarach]